MSEAVAWVASHKHSHHKVDVGPEYYRFRQHTPSHAGRYYTVTLKNGVEMVYNVAF
jgi:hypothetical protein